jgi:hypothetical protein
MQNNRFNRQRSSLHRENSFLEQQASNIPQMEPEYGTKILKNYEQFVKKILFFLVFEVYTDSYIDPYGMPPSLSSHAYHPSAPPPPSYQAYTSPPPLYYLAHPEM